MYEQILNGVKLVYANPSMAPRTTYKEAKIKDNNILFIHHCVDVRCLRILSNMKIPSFLRIFL